MSVETTVLLVDDDVALAGAMKRAIERDGHTVALAYSALEARARMNNWAALSFAVVILDQYLGDGLGTDLVVEFSRLRPPPAVCLFSGSFDFRLVREAHETGAIAFPRPGDPTMLNEVVEYLSVRRPFPSALAACEPRASAGQVFGRFCLKRTSFVTPRGVLELRPASAAVLAHLIERRTEWATTDELALAVFGRKPELQGGRGLVYHHVYALKAELGEHEWLVDSRRNVGYRLAPAALLVSTGLDEPGEVRRQSGESPRFGAAEDGAAGSRRAG
jgi:DNA-binding response OmpR family regulator